MVPLPGLVQQFLGVRQVERRRVLRVGRHRRGPRVLELQLGLWVVERQGSGVALHSDTLDTEVASTPHLVKHQLRISAPGNLCHRLLRHPQHALLLVVGQYTVHSFKVADVARPDGLLTACPQLAEVHRPAVEVGHVSHQQLALALPACHRHAAADGGTTALYGQSAVLGTQPQGLIQAVGPRGQADGNLAGLTQPAHLACLAHGIGQRRVRGDSDVCRLCAQTACQPGQQQQLLDLGVFARPAVPAQTHDAEEGLAENAARHL